MRSSISRLFVGSVALIVTLSACSATITPSSTPTSEQPGAATPSESVATVPAVASSDLKTATSVLGTIVVDGNGMTAYVYDKDVPNSGTSACTNECLTRWMPIETASMAPTVAGITGTTGTITDAAGNQQITINGRPIYACVDDKGVGDTNGQGADGSWWVISPSGEMITEVKSGQD